MNITTKPHITKFYKQRLRVTKKTLNMWNRIQAIVSAGTEKCIGICKSTKKKTWFNENSKEIIDSRNKITRNHVETTNK